MDIFFVIADPTRRRMIDMLADGPLAAGAFVVAFSSVSQPAVSQHLKVLRDSGLVTVTAQQQRRIYALEPQALSAVSAWVSPHMSRCAPKPAPAPRPRIKPIAHPVEPPPMLDLFG